MAGQTNIAWTRSTFNCWVGCTKVGPGCDGCYAEALDARMKFGGKGETHWGAGKPRHRTSVANWQQPFKWNGFAPYSTFAGRKGFWPVFCASMADVFDNEVPEEWRTDLWNVIRATPNLTWQLVTKRVSNIEKMLPDDLRERRNIWLVITVVNQDEADRDVPRLLTLPGDNLRGISYEPALGEVNWVPWLIPSGHFNIDDNADDKTVIAVAQVARAAYRQMGGRLLDWIIVGGESTQPGHKTRPFDIAWARSTLAQCKAAGVACFVKQLGPMAFDSGVSIPGDRLPLHNPPTDRELDRLERLMGFMGAVGQQIKDRSGSDPAEWPEDLRVQEFPA